MKMQATENLLKYIYTENCQNEERFDKGIAKIKQFSFVLLYIIQSGPKIKCCIAGCNFLSYEPI